MLKLNPPPKIITFDYYGTLVQWRRAMRQAARAILSAHSREGDTEDQAATLADKLREVAMTQQQHPPFRDYQAILHSSLDQALADFGCTASLNGQETLLSILRRIEPHPEVAAVLNRLRAHYQLAIISNTDDDLIVGTVAAIGIPIDFVIRAQQARAYKPDHRLFLHAHSVMGRRRRKPFKWAWASSPT